MVILRVKRIWSRTNDASNISSLSDLRYLNFLRLFRGPYVFWLIEKLLGYWIDVASFKKVFLNTFFDVTLSISSKYVANIGA